MKAAVLVCVVRGSNELVSFAAPTADEALAVARRVRESGKLNAIPVSAGLVLHSERPLPILKFSCAAPAPVVDASEKRKR